MGIPLSGFGVPTDYTAGGEVSVIDTDALLGDACDVLKTRIRSRLVAAIDNDAARIVMSEPAFFELGRMSAKSARGREVNDADLRREIEEQYLPRIPVVRVPLADSGCWMPSADDVTDPDDRAHVQVARLITARVVYSHDRHLRRPGFAPAVREAFDSRVGQLAILTQLKRAEIGIVVSGRLSFTGASWLVSRTKGALRVKSATAWTLLSLSVVGAGYVLLVNESRRQRALEVAVSLLEKLSAVFERGRQAQQALDSRGPIRLLEPPRLESRVGFDLARHPDSGVDEVARRLGLDDAERLQLVVMLREHPSFEPSSRSGWSVGRCRNRLETEPPPWVSR